MALPQSELTVRVKKISLCPVNGREERIGRGEDLKGGGGVRMILFSLKL